MGLKEDLEKLEAQRIAYLTQKEKERLATQELARKEKMRKEDKGLQLVTSLKLIDEVALQVFKPGFEELAKLLNSRNSTQDNPWQVIHVESSEEWSRYHDGNIDGDGGWTEKGLIEYKGYAMIRKSSNPNLRYEMIYGGKTFQYIGLTQPDPDHFGPQIEIAYTLGNGYEQDNIHIAEQTMDSSGYTEPKRRFLINLPQNQNEALSLMADPSSDAHINLRGQFDKATIAIVSRLPEYSMK